MVVETNIATKLVCILMYGIAMYGIVMYGNVMYGFVILYGIETGDETTQIRQYIFT